MKRLLVSLVLVTLLLVSVAAIAAEDIKKQPWLDHTWREATVAIGEIREEPCVAPDGRRNVRPVFKIIGTGLICGDPNDPTRLPWLVTAKHVFFLPSENWMPECLRIRFAWSEDKSVYTDLGIEIKLWNEGKALWLSHPNPEIDLATIPLKISAKQAGREKVSAITLDNFASEANVFEGAAIRVLGYPGLVGPEHWTRALTREGIIAWCNPARPCDEVIIIDSYVLPGNSGGPVFSFPSGFDQYGRLHMGGLGAFLGIVSRGGGGLGFVEPASKVKELIIHAEHGLGSK